MEEALFCQRESTNIIDNQLVPFLTKNDQGAVAKQIEAFKQVVIHDYLESYIGNPRGFFERFTKETMGHLNTIIKQNYTLYQQNLDLKKLALPMCACCPKRHARPFGIHSNA